MNDQDSRVNSIGQWKKTRRQRRKKKSERCRKWFFNKTYIAGWGAFAWHKRVRKRSSDQIIIIIIGIIIDSSCGDNSHSLLLLLNKFIGIQENIGSHQTIVYRTNQLFGLNLYRYGMCTRRFGVCTFVRTSERDRWRRTKSIFFSLFPFLSLCLSLFFSLSLYRTAKRERTSLKFSLACPHIHCALLLSCL